MASQTDTRTAASFFRLAIFWSTHASASLPGFSQRHNSCAAIFYRLNVVRNF
ncbi:hypothetical protein SB521682_5339 [Shigella boydii 5216-82]|nr:hypothetical protein SB521682_5339 [Shigella boydii 5216-82]